MTPPSLMNAEDIAHAIEAVQHQPILVVGDVMLDCYVHGNVNRISPEAPIPILVQDEVTAVPGGAANVARNLVHLGCNASLIGITGEDTQANQLHTALATLPQLEFMRIISADRPTTTKTRFMSSGQQMLRLDHEQTSPISDMLAAQIKQQVIAKLDACEMLVLSDYAKGMLTPTLLQTLIKSASDKNIPVVIDPKLTDFSAYAGASLLTPNLLELQRAAGRNITDIEDITTYAQSVIQTHNIGTMLVTMGARGMLIVKAETHHHLSAHLCDVYDVSGAGDTVIAAISALLSTAEDIKKAAEIGNLAASLVVSKLGTASLCPGELIAAGQSEPASTEIAALSSQIKEWRSKGLKIGFTNGCFDLLHAGHMHILKTAASHCDKLIVGVNSDNSVRKLKGDARPIQSEQTRSAILSALSYVDGVVTFDEDTPFELVSALSPDMIAKGGDYQPEDVVGADIVLAKGGAVHIIPLLSRYSTTSFLSSDKQA